MSRPVTSIRFLGASRTVTGSRFLVESPGNRVLVDCGMYQGDRELRRRNWQAMPLSATEINAVVLTHAHLDHCGWLPRLVRQGFFRNVYCSPMTARVAPIVLRDAAHLQEEDAERAASHGFSRHTPALPLFTADDAERAIALLRPVEFETEQAVGDVRLVLHRAGHILGSAVVELHTEAGTVAFSGDLGGPAHPLLRPPEPAPAADAIVVESTYGDRTHPQRRLDLLAARIRATFDRGGIVLVPAFAIDRTPGLLMALRTLMRAGELPTVPVYVDSPMALAALEIYRSAVRDGSNEIRDDVGTGVGDPFDPGELRVAQSVDESKAIDSARGPMIVISAAGMATGGRVLHHLARYAPDSRNLLLLPGFQVAGTRGRALLDGARSIKIFGGYVPVRAEVSVVEGLSSHADAQDLVSWLSTAPTPPQTCYVVHGEPDAAAALAGRISDELGWCVVVPRYDERVLLKPAFEPVV